MLGARVFVSTFELLEGGRFMKISASYQFWIVYAGFDRNRTALFKNLSKLFQSSLKVHLKFIGDGLKAALHGFNLDGAF